MPKVIQFDSAPIIESAQQIFDSLQKSRAAAVAVLRTNIDTTIKALEAQPAEYNVAVAKYFRTIHFDDGGKVSGVIRGWKLKYKIFIIPGLDGFLVPSDDTDDEGRFLPFQNFLHQSDLYGLSYIDLVVAITELHDSAMRRRGGDGQEN